MLCDVASIFVVRTLIVSQAYTMVLTLIDNTRIHIFMYSIPRRHFTCPFADLFYKQASMVQWLFHVPYKPEMAGLIRVFLRLSDETIN